MYDFAKIDHRPSTIEPILYLTAPAYNESENISQFIEDWYPVIERHNGNGLSRLLIIDDGSRDNTYEILKAHAETKPLLLPITKSNTGHGNTCIFAYKYAIDNGADYIFQTDSDGQTSPDEFESFWALRNDYDAVLGTRPDRKDGAARVFISDVMRVIERVIFGVTIPDANVPYRLMKSELVSKYLPLVTDDLFLSNVMLAVCFVYFHENVKFEYISFGTRQGGKSFVNLRSIIKIGLRTVNDFLKLRKKFRACKFS